MSIWTYYSPIGVGFLLVLILHETVGGYAPVEWPLWTRWPFVIVIGILSGLLCQLLLIGVQGAFAQVLPVPVGRSIRGRGAVLGGSLIITTVALASIAGLLKIQDMPAPAVVSTLLCLVAAVGAVITYFWCWPVAIRDFHEGKR